MDTCYAKGPKEDNEGQMCHLNTGDFSRLSNKVQASFVPRDAHPKSTQPGTEKVTGQHSSCKIIKKLLRFPMPHPCSKFSRRLTKIKAGGAGNKGGPARSA